MSVQFRIYGKIPSLNKRVDETIEASSEAEARKILESRLKEEYPRTPITVGYCIVEKTVVLPEIDEEPYS